MEKFEDFLKNPEIKRAFDFAKSAHAGQYRKIYKDGEKLDYFTHPEQVAELVYKLKNSKEIEKLIISAILHDTVEDCGISLEEIKELFGDLVFSLVKELTNNPIERGNMTKERYLINKMLNMTSWGLVIKLCDRLHNISDLKFSTTKNEIEFAKYYIKQTRTIMNSLREKRDLTNTQKTIMELIEDKLDELSF